MAKKATMKPAGKVRSKSEVFGELATATELTKRQVATVFDSLADLIKGLTPIPYKVVTIYSGLMGFDLKVFIAASVVTRGARFFLVAGLLYCFGEPVRDFIERRLTLVTTLFVVAVVGGFVALRYLF